MGKVICVVAAALAVLFSLSGDASADGMTVKNHARKAWRTPPSCAPLVRIRTRAPRCTALMGPMAAPPIGPGIRTQAGIDKPLAGKTVAARGRPDLGNYLSRAGF